jgi:hypothetical protein
MIAATAALGVLAGPAAGHGGEGAHAKRPVLKEGPLRLAGAGGYETERNHAGDVRITVCLEKRYSSGFVAVRCNSKTAPGNRVVARVSVPGCVRGVWRTVAYGQAQNAAGEWRHAAIDTSRRYRCD